MVLDMDALTPHQRQDYLQHAIAPRPICFASTVDGAGNVNLSPFSFFNVFSITPPVIIFSPSRRVRDNSIKHTWQNVLEVPEVVVNIVDYDMVFQTSLASCDYPPEIDEFTKAGFQAEPATLVRPPMVKESKVKLECRVIETKSLGTQGGAGNLVMCEVLRMHIHSSVLTNDGTIDQQKLQLVARLGRDWYCRVGPDNLFEVPKPHIRLGIGFDNLPPSIRHSAILTGNDLGQLANVEVQPQIDPSFHDAHLDDIIQYYGREPEEMEAALHAYAKQLLLQGKVHDAWQVLLAVN